MAAKINFYNEEASYLVKHKMQLRKWLQMAITEEGFVTGPINIILTNDEYLAKMNLQYLQHDTLTDIITFDYTEADKISGDLFISIERIADNAKTFSRSVAEELHRVMVHGVLHLCGYTDKKPIEKKNMTRMEDHYLSLRPDGLKDSA
jgi:rRNA maturation RNase YbeY